jgi:hypothetical protein
MASNLCGSNEWLAWKAGECQPEPEACLGCHNINRLPEQCDCCRDNPDPNPDMEIYRWAKINIEWLTGLLCADEHRREQKREIRDPQFQAAIRDLLANLGEDGNTLFEACEGQRENELRGSK